MGGKIFRVVLAEKISQVDEMPVSLSLKILLSRKKTVGHRVSRGQVTGAVVVQKKSVKGLHIPPRGGGALHVGTSHQDLPLQIAVIIRVDANQNITRVGI